MSIESVPAKVFRAYDIRGIVGSELDEVFFYRLGLALAHQLHAVNRNKALVGKDGRLSSPTLSGALLEGLVAGGIDVYDIGMVTTPMLYFATHQSGIDSGFMITGSHNPAEYNGIKMVIAGSTLVQEDILNLYQLLKTSLTSQKTLGMSKKLNVEGLYQQAILERITLKRPLKVVVDCGNGVAGGIAPKVLRALGCDVVELYCDIDGRFPNHHPDPADAKNLVDLQQAILKESADLGLAFDGDADRLGLVTNTLDIIWPDRLMMFFSKDLLKERKGATIVFDVKCSKHLPEIIEAHGGRALMCPTGHSIVKRKMREEQAALAGEMSGHLFFADRWYGFDDALYSACRLLEIISKDETGVSSQFANIPDSVNTPELKIMVHDEHKFDLMAKLIEKVEFPQSKRVEIDGLRVEFADGWGLIRASNTTPCLVARFEADNDEALKRIQQHFKEQILRIDPDLILPF